MLVFISGIQASPGVLSGMYFSAGKGVEQLHYSNVAVTYGTHNNLSQCTLLCTHVTHTMLSYKAGNGRHD